MLVFSKSNLQVRIFILVGRYIMFANGCVQAAAVSLLLMAWSKEWRYINYDLERRAKEDEERKLEMKVEEILETTRE